MNDAPHTDGGESGQAQPYGGRSISRDRKATGRDVTIGRATSPYHAPGSDNRGFNGGSSRPGGRYR